jgi:allantoinase
LIDIQYLFSLVSSIHLHIANISSAKAVSIYKQANPRNPITLETCPHYLLLNSNDIPDAKTEFKTSPPIRDKENQQKLLDELRRHNIDIVTSAHSSTLPGIKCTTYGKTRGNFLQAWSGIASLQYTLPLLWTFFAAHGLTVADIVRVLCTNPANLIGMQMIKSRIAVGCDGDFCIWDPDEEFVVHKDSIQHQIKSTPYIGRRLKGVVYATILRGCLIYEIETGIGPREGRVILKRVPTTKVTKS